MERFCQPPSGPPLKQHREVIESIPTDSAGFVEINLMVRHKKTERRGEQREKVQKRSTPIKWAKSSLLSRQFIRKAARQWAIFC